VPKIKSVKRETLVAVRLGPTIGASLAADAAQIERTVSDTAALRLAEYYAKHIKSDDLPAPVGANAA
jgi:hypothetical protein